MLWAARRVEARSSLATRQPLLCGVGKGEGAKSDVTNRLLVESYVSKGHKSGCCFAVIGPDPV